jgi:hypothetical protein
MHPVLLREHMHFDTAIVKPLKQTPLKVSFGRVMTECGCLQLLLVTNENDPDRVPLERHQASSFCALASLVHDKMTYLSAT